MSVLPHNAFYNASRHRNRLSNNNSLKLQRIGLNIDSRNIVSDTPPIIHPSRSTISLHSLKNPPIHFNSSPPKDVLLRNNKTIRNYQLSDSDVRFCCSGHGITSKDNPTTFIISIILVLGLPAVFFGRIAVDLWYTLSPAVPIIAAYLTLLVWSSMLKTAFAEPGILPTQLDSDAQDSVHRDITLRDGLVTVKYCDICHIFRPPRASHCRLCNSCVDGIDHHCSFLNICIGRRNYPSFLTFCTITTLTLAYFAAFSAVHIYQLTLNTRVSHSQSFGDALQQDPASAVVFIVSVVFFIPISLLLAYHIRVSMALIVDTH